MHFAVVIRTISLLSSFSHDIDSPDIDNEISKETTVYTLGVGAIDNSSSFVNVLLLGIVGYEGDHDGILVGLFVVNGGLVLRVG